MIESVEEPAFEFSFVDSGFKEVHCNSLCVRLDALKEKLEKYVEASLVLASSFFSLLFLPRFSSPEMFYSYFSYIILYVCHIIFRLSKLF